MTLMALIQKIFNFDNIGEKIKNSAKKSCWTTIFFIWLAAPISLIFLLLNEDTAYLFWIPIVAAVFVPFIIWTGFWAMYAFGQFIDDIHAIRQNEGQKNTVASTATVNRTAQPSAPEKAKNPQNSENRIGLMLNAEDDKSSSVSQGAELKANDSVSSHKWLCDGCQKMRTQSPCEHCGKA